MVQPHRDLAADQGGRHRVDHLAYLDRAGTPHAGPEQLVDGKAKGRLGTEMLEFLLVAPLPVGVEGAKYLGQQLAVLGCLLEIAASAPAAVSQGRAGPRRCRSHGPPHGCSGFGRARNVRRGPDSEL